jgi:heme exporter protein A
LFYAAEVIALHNVRKAYGPVRALAGVSCTFRPGRVTVVRGPNGSGKSTLLSIVGTMTKVSSGRVDYGDLGASRSDVRRTLGWLGHDSLCYPDLTGRQNIELAARLHGRDPDGAYVQASRRFDLEAYAERPARTYSRGQRQRIALARALVHAPRLILLDEPTAGLDASTVERLLTVVREEAGRGATLVLVTHDPEFARAVGTDEITLDRGRSLVVGS